jgi:TusA-related sulfurtransferase
LGLKASDVDSKEDVPAWCKRIGNELIDAAESDEIYTFYIKKS